MIKQNHIHSEVTLSCAPSFASDIHASPLIVWGVVLGRAPETQPQGNTDWRRAAVHISTYPICPSPSTHLLQVCCWDSLYHTALVTTPAEKKHTLMFPNSRLGFFMSLEYNSMMMSRRCRYLSASRSAGNSGCPPPQKGFIIGWDVVSELSSHNTTQHIARARARSLSLSRIISR